MYNSKWYIKDPGSYNYPLVCREVLQLYKQSRKAAGLSRQQLADIMGLHFNTIMSIERGNLLNWLTDLRKVQFWLLSCGFTFNMTLHQVAVGKEEIIELLKAKKVKYHVKTMDNKGLNVIESKDLGDNL